jgi:hypothetical protein
MDMKDFSKYLKYKSFDEAVHQIRRISLERVVDSESAGWIIQQGDEGKKRHNL